MRKTLLALVVVCGCSKDHPAAVPVQPATKSFVECDAIWKDETKKLEALEDDYARKCETATKAETAAAESAWNRELGQLASMLRQHSAGTDFLSEEEFNKLYEVQEGKVDAAKVAMDEAMKPDRPKGEYRESLERKYEPLIAEQQRKVDEAYKAKEDAKH